MPEAIRKKGPTEGAGPATIQRASAEAIRNKGPTERGGPATMYREADAEDNNPYEALGLESMFKALGLYYRWIIFMNRSHVMLDSGFDLKLKSSKTGNDQNKRSKPK